MSVMGIRVRHCSVTFILTKTKFVDKWHDVLLVILIPLGDKTIHTSVAQPEPRRTIERFTPDSEERNSVGPVKKRSNNHHI